MISRQGEKGPEWKYDLLPVYGIYLLNFSLPEFPSWRTDVVLANEQTGRIRLKQIYVSFERFDLRYEECVTPLEKTIYVLKNMNLFDMSPLKEKEAHFRRLLDGELGCPHPAGACHLRREPEDLPGLEGDDGVCGGEC